MHITEVDVYYQQPLARTYLLDYSRVGDFFAYSPGSSSEVKKRLAYLTRQSRDFSQIAGVLEEYNRQLGCGTATLRNIELLQRGQAVAVVTGQQPGIFTGPLYTVYKALGTIILAGRLSEELNLPVIPVFWIGADDHDFREINHVHISTSQGPVKIGLADGPYRRVSLGHLPVPEEIFNCIKELEELTPPLGWQQGGLKLLRETAEQSQSLADWFGRIMANLFKNWGLVLVNPVLRQMRQLSANIFHHAVKTAPVVETLLSKKAQEINERGFKAQVHSEDNKCHLFIYENGERQALYLRQEGFVNRDGSASWERRKLEAITLSKPELFSPDVVLRPVVQEELFPVLIYMAGPGEIGYYAMLKEVFQHFSQEMPVIWPRPNITIVEPQIAKLVKKYEVPLEQTLADIEVIVSQELAKKGSINIKQTFSSFNSFLSEQYKELMRELAVLDPELKGLAQQNLRRVRRLISSLEEKAHQSHRKSNIETTRQLRKIGFMLNPNRQWQERSFNIFPYLMKYPELLEYLSKNINVSDWRHKFLLID